ncbi:MAG: hypothetical protein KDC93_11115 [Cyclobacteriaceae bacterium]|jgi:hypothetical protein|nr:hypothetical protein [Cyclobacteriaceae bacterium]
MRPFVLLIICLLVASLGFGQSVTYYKDIEPIIVNNCVTCHRPGGLGPFSLMTYEEVSNKGNFIAHVTKTKYMPPWQADPLFQTFRNEKILTDTEIQTIQDWVKGGMTKGRKSKRKAIAEVEEEIVTQPDLSLKMGKPFEISDKSVEEFRFFSIPTNLPEDTYVSAIEFIPGNRRLVHHSRLMSDTTNDIRGIDGMSELDPRVKNFQKTPLADDFLYGWVPGNNKIFFPPNTGKLLYKSTDLILNMHYSPSSKKETDQSKINLYFAKTEVDRVVHTLTLRENDIVNQPFYIYAETSPTFYINYKVDKDISLISLLPHMHFIGKRFKAVAETPSGEIIPLIKIDKWDFNWQTTYQFKHMLKIPAGSYIKMEAQYDNSSNNKANPFVPARNIGYGWGSTSEMCNLIIYYLDYREGDEEIDY